MPSWNTLRYLGVEVDDALQMAAHLEVFGDEKMTTALLDRITHHCDILETGLDLISL